MNFVTMLWKKNSFWESDLVLVGTILVPTYLCMPVWHILSLLIQLFCISPSWMMCFQSFVPNIMHLNESRDKKGKLKYWIINISQCTVIVIRCFIQILYRRIITNFIIKIGHVSWSLGTPLLHNIWKSKEKLIL
jgi:hypothetical protein